MKNLFKILGVLAALFIILLIVIIVKTDFSKTPALYDKISANFNQPANQQINLNVGDEEVEDVGDLQFYTQQLGRSDVDIQSKRTYTFYLPVDIIYETQGVDAASGILVFKKDGQEIFRLSSFDYAKSEDNIDEFWPTADDFSLIGGHTNILELINDDYEDEMYIFADTLKIDGVAAF